MLDRAIQISILQLACENTDKFKELISIVNKDLNLNLTNEELKNLENVNYILNKNKSILYTSILYFLNNLNSRNVNTVFENFEIISEIINHKLKEIGKDEIEKILLANNIQIEVTKEEVKKTEPVKQVKKEEEFEDIFI